MMRGPSRKSSPSIFPIIAILAVSFLLASVTSQSTGFEVMPNESKYTGSIAEYSLSTDGDLIEEATAAEEEFEMDSEINRRILANTRYISYGALRRNTVPCSRRGASYYNCRRGAQANPYTRGCSAITRCRR